MKEKVKYYKQLHEWRVRLRCGGMLSDKENESIKQRIEKWGVKNKVPTVGEYLATLNKINTIKQRAPIKH